VSHPASSLASEVAAVPPKLAAARAPASLWPATLLVVLLAAGGALFLFNPAEHAFYPRCFFHQATGLHCPGCGGLRAMHQLLHGHFLVALQLNALAVLALPLVGWLFAREHLGRRTSRSMRESAGARWVWGVVTVMLLFSLLRNLPMFAFLSP